MGHSQEEWKKIINQFRESGLSQRKWCAIHVIILNFVKKYDILNSSIFLIW